MGELSRGSFVTMLTAYEDELRESLRDVAQVRRARLHVSPAHDDNFAVQVCPNRPESRGISWLWFGELVVQVDEQIGAWELDPTSASLALLQDLVEAVVAGRVVEAFALERSSVVLTRVDGRVETSVGARGVLGMVPLPGWRRWGRAVARSPYQVGELPTVQGLLHVRDAPARRLRWPSDRDAVRAILNDWDPIGVRPGVGEWPPDEYDDLVDVVMGSLKRGATRARLTGALMRAVDDRLGLPDTVPPPRVIDALVEWWEQPVAPTES